jgi:ABC-type uncharacterized transport system substrate-binding protein
VRCKCLLLTQSGHAPFKDAGSVDTIGQSGLGPSMRRREFIALLGVTVVGPVPAFAQQPVRQVAILSSFNENSAEVQVYIAALREGLAKLGWEEGRNIHIEFRWAGSDTELTRRLAKEVVGLRPDLIIATNSPSTAMLLQLTRTIPIVFPNIVDPVGQGFASSLARPGGNATGLVNLEPSMAGKWIELLKELMPAMSRVVVPYNPATTPYADLFLNYFKSTSTTLGVSINAVPLENMSEFEKIAGIQSQQPNTGFVPIPSAFMTGRAREVGALMVQHRLPALYVTREFAASGGLISYGNDVSDNYRRAAKFVDRILKGESPSALPIELPIKFALIINLKTAKTLGLTVPLHMQQIADEVIE